MADDVQLTIDQGETITVSVEDAGPDADVIVTLGTDGGGGGGGSTAWADITGKPSTFPPDTHTHPVSEIQDFVSSVQSLLTWSSVTGKPSTFTPSAHAASHASGGSDPVTVGSSEGRIVVTTTGGRLQAATSIASASVTAGQGGTLAALDQLVSDSLSYGLPNYIDGNGAWQPPSHTHAAGHITSGVIAAARLASTGTASASTYLRGDQTWATISSYTLPAATTTTLGGVIVGTGLGVTSGTVSVTYGTTSTTACRGDDSRLSDARVPTSHFHGNISAAGAIGLTAGQIVVTTTSGVLTTAATIASTAVSGLGGAATLNVGTTAGTVAAGDDSRMANTRTPTDGTVTTAKIVDANVTIAKLSATGTASASTFLRGDGAWATAGSTSASDLTSGTLPEGRLPNLVIIHPFLLAGM